MRQPLIPLLPGGDYRIFVGAFLTGALAAEIQAVRAHYDVKTAVKTPPHVTLAGTYWRIGAATAANETAVCQQLQAIGAMLRPFVLELSGIHTFGQGVIYLDVALMPDLLETRRTLVQNLGQDKHRQFQPHLTLAMRLNPAQAQAMMAELRASRWENGRYLAPISELHLMQRGSADLAWRTIGRFPLAV